MKRILILSCLSVFGVCGFAMADLPPFVKNVLINFKIQNGVRLQEKVWLHTDRECYQVGEQVWFRAFLVDAATNRESSFSAYVYVELVNHQDSVLRRVKIVRRDSAFYGHLDIGPDIPQGEYCLRAYSYWMQNSGEDFIYKKKIKIVNPMDSRVLTGVTYEIKDSSHYAVVRLTNSRDEPYRKVGVSWKLMGEEYKGKERRTRTDDEGRIRIPLKNLNNPGEVLLRFTDEDMFDFKRFVHLPDQSGEFDLAFFPEGGDWLPECEQKVAYKAIGTDGLSVEVKGLLYDEGGNVMDIMQTFHKGMGFLNLKAEVGKRYYAEVEIPGGKKKKFQLPESNPRGIALTMQQLDSMLMYRVICGPQAKLNDSLYLLVHMRGMFYACMPLNGNLRGQIPLNEFPAGILHVCLMDSQYRVYSQRLCFVRERKYPEIAVNTDKKGYLSREAVELCLNMEGEPGQSGSFSLSVTDDATVSRDSALDDIVSGLLLTSDLKGHIEDPCFYFRNVSKATDRCLDLLMMTQGWTRFDVSKVAAGEFTEVNYYMERGQAISGKVKNFWGKEAKEAQLILFSSNQIFRVLNTDSTGQFLVDGIAFPDSTSFIVQARSKKGRKSVEVIVDKDKFLRPDIRLPYARQEANGEDDFFKKYGKDYYYDNGVKVYILDEALVRRQPPKKQYTFYDHMARWVVDSAKLAQTNLSLITFLGMEFPGVMAMNNQITYMGKDLYLVMDEMVEEYDRISMMDPKEFLSICLLDGFNAQFYFGVEAKDGALVFTRNFNYIPEKANRLNKAVFIPLGYQKAAQFYMPRYDVDSVRLAMADTMDIRPTLYWNPNVSLKTDSPAYLQFFTDDGCENATLILEGILKDGTVCRKEKKIRLKAR